MVERQFEHLKKTKGAQTVLTVNVKNDGVINGDSAEAALRLSFKCICDISFLVLCCWCFKKKRCNNCEVWVFKQKSVYMR